MFCPNCGQEVLGNPNFCPHCGKSHLSTATEAAPPIPVGKTPLPSPVTTRERVKRDWSQFQCPTCGGAFKADYPYCRACRVFLSDQWEASCPRCPQKYHEQNTSCINCEGPLAVTKTRFKVKHGLVWKFGLACVNGCGLTPALCCEVDGPVITPDRIQASIAMRPWWVLALSYLFLLVTYPFAILVFLVLHVITFGSMAEELWHMLEKFYAWSNITMCFALTKPYYKWVRPGQKATPAREWT